MLKIVRSKTVALPLRYSPNALEAMVISYCRNRAIGNTNQMLQRAINAFYLPLAYSESGKSSLEVEQMAIAAIHELLAQDRYIRSVCLFLEHEDRPSLRQLTEKKRVMSKEVFATLKAESGTDDALALNYCRYQKFDSTGEVVRRAINTFYLPLAYLKVGKSCLEVKHLALAAIHELQVQSRLIRKTCLPKTLKDVVGASLTNCPRHNSSESLIWDGIDIPAQVESSVLTAVEHAITRKEFMLNEQDWSCC